MSIQVRLRSSARRSPYAQGFCGPPGLPSEAFIKYFSLVDTMQKGLSGEFSFDMKVCCRGRIRAFFFSINTLSKLTKNIIKTLQTYTFPEQTEESKSVGRAGCLTLETSFHKMIIQGPLLTN